MTKVENKRKEAKAYSLLVVPSSTLAIELGKIRKRRKDNKEVLENLTRLLHLSAEEIHQMERGELDGIDCINTRLKMYFDCVGATMNNLYKKDECTVSIPDLKGKSLGTKTYLMAIDAYTTKFSNRDDLLDDIRKKGYSDISSYTNEELWLFIERPKHGNLDRIKPAYSDNEKLISFINNTNIGYSFDLSNLYVQKINEMMTEVLRSKPILGKVDGEFKIFVRENSQLYSHFWSNQNWDKRYGSVGLEGAHTYLGIRQYCIAYEQFKKEKEEIRRQLIPFNERAEEDYRYMELASEPTPEPKITDTMYIFDAAFRPNAKLEKTDVIPNQLQLDFGDDHGLTR